MHRAGSSLHDQIEWHGECQALEIIAYVGHLLVDDYRQRLGVAVEHDVDETLYHRTPVEVDERFGQLYALLYKPRTFSGGYYGVMHCSCGDMMDSNMLVYALLLLGIAVILAQIEHYVVFSFVEVLASQGIGVCLIEMPA